MTRKMFITPPDTPEDEQCRPLNIPSSKEWLGIFNRALLETTLPHNWEQIHETDMTVDAAANHATSIFMRYLDDTCGSLPPPFWDDNDGDDADGNEESPFAWYEDASDWLVQAFLATTFTPQAATVFVTTARNLRLWFRTRDYGAIVRVLIDGLEVGSVDTYSAEAGLVEFAYDIPEALALSAQDAESWVLRLEHTGTANASATPTADGYAVEIIRKHLRWGFSDDEECYYRLRFNTTLNIVEVYNAATDTWQPAPEFDPRTIYQYPPVDTANPRCDAAARMTALIRESVEIQIDGVDNAATQIFIATSIIAAVSFAVGAGIVVPLVIEFLGGVLSFGSLALHEAFDNYNWDAMQCKLYCLVDSDGRIGQAGVDALYDWIVDVQQTVTEVIVLGNVLNYMGYGILSDGAAVRTEIGDCDECLSCDWQVSIYPDNVSDFGGEFRFYYANILRCTLAALTSYDIGGEVYNKDGVNVWRTTPSQVQATINTLKLHYRIHIPASSEVQRVRIYWAQEGAVNSVGWWVYVNDIALCNPASVGGTHFNVPNLSISDDWLDIRFEIAYNQSRNAYVNAIVIDGVGYNPFL